MGCDPVIESNMAWHEGCGQVLLCTDCLLLVKLPAGDVDGGAWSLDETRCSIGGAMRDPSPTCTLGVYDSPGVMP